MKPYVKKSIDDKNLIKEIIEEYKEQFPKRKIKYHIGVFYITEKHAYPKGNIVAVLDYKTLKAQIEGTGIPVEAVVKERVKKVYKRKRK